MHYDPRGYSQTIKTPLMVRNSQVEEYRGSYGNRAYIFEANIAKKYKDRWLAIRSRIPRVNTVIDVCIRECLVVPGFRRPITDVNRSTFAIHEPHQGDGWQVPAKRTEVDDPDSSEYLKQLAVLRLARLELGDKTLY